MAERKQIKEKSTENLKRGVFLVNGGQSDEDIRLVYNILVQLGLEVSPMVLKDRNAVEYILAFKQETLDQSVAESSDLARFSIVFLSSSGKKDSDILRTLVQNLGNAEIDLPVFKIINPQDLKAIDQVYRKIVQRSPLRPDSSSPVPKRLTHSSKLLYGV